MPVAALLLGLLAGAPQPEPFELNAPDFEIPIAVRPDLKPTVRELLLWVSRDEGESWQLVERVPPDRRSFTYHARHDGVYWFSVAVLDDNGRQEPADVTRVPPGLKVRVRTTTRPEALPPRPVPPPPAEPFAQRLDEEIEALRHEVKVKQERLRAMEKLRRLLSEEPR